jgi:AraC-like DNA-binding protein
MHLLDLGLRAGGAILLLSLGALLLLRSRGRIVGVTAAALAGSVGAHLLCPLAAQRWGLTLLTSPLLIVCIAVPAIFWLFVQALCKDGFRVRVRHAVAILTLLAAGLIDVHLTLSATQVPAIARLANAVGAKLLALAFVVAALITVYTGRGPDLLQARRALRDKLIAAGGAYMVVVVAVELYLHGTNAMPLLSLLNAMMTIAFALLVVAGLLRFQRDLFLGKPESPEKTLDAADRAILERLTRAIEVDRIHRREGLTITGLAEALHVQEYRLRRVINQHLGFRNFNDFLNQRRIRDACERLSDPAQSSSPILTIALDVGYRSLSPFNRAFRDQTGLTPSQYRREKAPTAAPIDSAQSG